MPRSRVLCVKLRCARARLRLFFAQSSLTLFAGDSGDPQPADFLRPDWRSKWQQGPATSVPRDAREEPIHFEMHDFSRMIVSGQDEPAHGDAAGEKAAALGEILFWSGGGQNASVPRTLRDLRIGFRQFREMQELCGAIERSCAVVVVEEENLTPRAWSLLCTLLDRQPPWSEVPVILLRRQSTQNPAWMEGVETRAGIRVVTIESGIETLRSVVDAALSARRRQCEAREQIEAQRDREERLVGVLEHVSDAFAVLDSEWRFTYVNRGYLHLLAPQLESEAQLLGSSLWMRFPELAGTELERFYRRVMAEQAPGSLDVYDAGRNRCCEVRAHPTPRSLTIYAADVTDRRRAEKALRESEARYRALMERAQEGIFVSDERGRHVMVNPAGCEMLGYSLEEILQLRSGELYELGETVAVQQEIKRMHEGDVLHHERRMRRHDGALVHVEASITRLSNGLIQCVARDVTARKSAEELQQRKNRREQLLSETLGLLLGAGNPEVIVQQLFPKVAASLGVEVYLYFMMEEPGNILRLHSHAGLDVVTASALARVELAQALQGVDLQIQRQIAEIARPADEEEQAETFERLRLTAYVCNPLIVGERLLGTLSFGSREREAFQPEELEFLRVVSQYTAVALDRLRATRELKGRTRTLEILNRIGATLSGELDADRLAQALTEAGREVTGAEYGAFFYTAACADGDFCPLYTLAGAPGIFEKLTMPRNTPLFGAMLRGEGVTRIGDVVKDRRYGRIGSNFGIPKGNQTVRSFLAVPVISRSGEVLGGLFFGHSDPNVFQEDLEPILGGIAAQAAIAMDNARLYENVQTAADRLSLSISAANLGDFTWDAKTDSILLSPRTAEIYGIHARDELTRSELRELLDPEDQARSRVELQKSVATRSDYDIEYRITRPDGVQRWVTAKGRPFYDADGRVSGMVGVVQDITMQKHVEAVSEAKRRVLYMLAEGASLEDVLDALIRSVELESMNQVRGSILILDADQVHLRHGASPSLPRAVMEASDMLAIGPMVGACGSAVFHKRPVYVADIETDPAFAPFRDIAMAHNLRACWSTPIYSSTGAVLGAFAIYYSEPLELHDADMRVVESATRTAAVAIERREHERALQESEARQRQLLARLPVACYTMDRDGRLTFFNAAAERLWGKIPELEKELWTGAFSPTVGDGKRVALQDGPAALALKEKRSVRGVEGFIMRPDGSRRWVVPHPDPMFDAAGICVGVINVIVDVTDERHAKRMLQEAKETAEAASVAKDRFLAVLSHELRTPLTPVLMSVASLEHDPSLPEDTRHELAMVRRNVELETKLIDDLLDLSRVTTGKLRLRLQSMDFNEATQHVCDICRPQISEKHIRLECDLDPEAGNVAADPARLRQVLWNVLKNAAKFTPEDGEIQVTTKALGDRVEVRVQDSGPGIAPDLLPRVFEAFEQGQGVTRQFGGLGLGLAISKALVELHGGTIRVESDGIGKGSCFSIEVPRRHPAESFLEVKAPKAAPGESKHLKVLVVEDHADTARTLGRLLGRVGYSVSIAGCVEAALKQASEGQFDVILSDLGLPDGSGYDLIETLRERGPVRAIAMSGFGMDEDIRKSREAGFAEHIVKPVNLTDLLDAIRRISASVVPAKTVDESEVDAHWAT